MNKGHHKRVPLIDCIAIRIEKKGIETMVFSVGNYKVTMTAKTSIQGCYGIYEDAKNSSEKAMAFMNMMALLAFKAAQSYEREKDTISANEARKIAHQITEQIDKTGYYRI